MSDACIASLTSISVTSISVTPLILANERFTTHRIKVSVRVTVRVKVRVWKGFGLRSE